MRLWVFKCHFSTIFQLYIWHVHLEKCKKKSPLSRPTKYSSAPTMSDQILGVGGCWLSFIGHFSGVSRTFWEGYVRPESMSVDTLGVYCRWKIYHLVLNNKHLLIVIECWNMLAYRQWAKVFGRFQYTLFISYINYNFSIFFIMK